MKRIYVILALSMIGTSIPLVLLASTFSIQIWWDVGIYGTSGQANVTIGPPNPLLGNKYVIIAGGEFILYEGTVDCNITIVNRDTGANQTRRFSFDATSTYVEVSFGSCEFTLEPGEYSINYSSNLINLAYYLYSKGWLINPNNPIIPDNIPNPNDVQGLLCLLFVGILAGLGIYLFFKIRENRK